MAKRKSDNVPIPLPVKHLLEQWGKAIHAQRQKSNLTMREFTYRLNISLDTLQRLERGEPSVQAATYLGAMLVLGFMDELCRSPDEGMTQSSRARVRSANKDDDDYF